MMEVWQKGDCGSR